MADEDYVETDDGTIGDEWGLNDVAPETAPATIGSGRREAIYDVSIDVVAILGTAELQVAQILKLGRGAVVELERLIGEPVELRANNIVVAHGEVVVIEDRLAIRLTEIARSELDQS